MTPDIPVGQILTLDEAIEYYERVTEAEKEMGPLSKEEKMVILKSVGKEITAEDLLDLLAGKRALIVRGKDAH